MKENTTAGADFGADVVRGADANQGVGVKNVYNLECFDRDGRLKWRDVIENLVVNVGLDDLLDKYLKGSGYTAAFYVGLTDGTPTVAAADTMASHAGWVEVHSTYSEGTRPALTLGTVSGQSVNNSASKAVFTFTGSATVGGAFVATNSTKNGSTGTLFGAGAFTGGDKAMDNGDTLNVTVTATASSS